MSFLLLLYVCISDMALLGQAKAAFHSKSKIQFEHFSLQNGLASEKVISVAQDPQGFLWIGTQEGLHRYDGFELRQYLHEPQDSLTISDDAAEHVYVDHFGTLWIGTWNGLNRYDPITETFRRYYYNPSDPSSLSHSQIHNILEDKEGRLWIATRDGGLCRYDREHDNFVRYLHDPLDSSSISYDVATVLYVDRRGTLWVGTGLPWDDQSNRGGLNRYDPGRDAFVRYEHDPQDSSSLQNNEISALYEDADGNFWVATWGDGLQIMNREDGTFAFPRRGDKDAVHPKWPYLRTQNGPNGTIKFFHEDAEGILWIGGFLGGLDRYDPLSQTLTTYSFSPDKPEGLSDNAVWSIFEDRQHILWVSTWKGLNKVSPKQSAYTLLRPGLGQFESLKNSHIEEVLEDHEGNLWIGSWSGLDRIDPTTKQSTHFTLGSGQGSKVSMVLSIYEDKAGTIWVGTLSDGLFRFDRASQSFSSYDNYFNAGNNKITGILEDQHGNIWVNSNLGLSRLDPQLGRFTSGYKIGNPSRDEFEIFALAAGRDSMIWLGSERGLDQLDPSTGIITSFLEGYVVMAIIDDDAQGIWLGTSGAGLLHFDPLTACLTSNTMAEGMPSNVVRGLIKDKNGYLWISTNQGLAWLPMDEDVVSSFSKNQAPPIYLFYPHSLAMSQTGELFFGGNGGIVKIDPTAILKDSLTPLPVLTGLRLFNESIPLSTISTPSNAAPSLKTIALTHDQNDLTFEYAGLHFIRPEENTYRYKLENYEKEWRYVNEQRSAIYPNLPPGEYVFRLQAANPDGVWSTEEAGLKVNISPPWWKTKAAMIGFGLLLVLGIGIANRIQRKRLLKAERTRASLSEAQYRAEVAETHAQKLKSLDEAKTNLYANITHEFRTPLTVILGMIDNIKGHKTERALIQRNSQNLLRLINQLLDLSKLETGSMKLDLVQRDIIAYLQYLTESFYSMAEDQQLRLTFESEVEEWVMDFDEDKIQQIIYNLLANALKFTDKGGKIVLYAQQLVEEETIFLQLKVQDTGIGIPSDQLERIFDRFYQTDNSSSRQNEGTGIGLAHTKELIELMGGQLSVESTLGQGSCFLILLPASIKDTISPQKSVLPINPLAKSVSDDLASPKIDFADIEHLNSNDPKPVLLLIEDNTDIVIYIKGLLKSTYDIHTAINGEIGLEEAFERVPDIIISDVMMPQKSGYEVCQILKNDQRTSHIPIILLTAKATFEDRMEGLQGGADAYLVKPFRKEELFVRLDKLLALRKTLQANYGGEKLFAKKALVKKEPSLDELFLQKLILLVQKRLSDPELGVSHLCEIAKLSNNQLNRKLKALTGKTPSQFIRSIRLQRALELLETTALNISEIAYDVGFNDPNYFSRLFSEEFGYSPKTIRK
ncbi:MAG: two-component regulator propeller domain-containing protein [Bacteroidia bacterium]